MEHDHEGQRVSRRTLVRGLSLLSLGGVLAACAKETEGTPTATAPATGTTGSDLFAGLAACALTLETTQGPYYFDADKVRSDIREDRAGKRLRVAIKVQDSETCAPVPNAVVEIWHCDADGLYSGAEAQSTGGGGGPGGGAPPGGGGPGGTPPSGGPGPGGGNGGIADLVPTDDKRYLRGAQVTNGEGVVEFTTVWPGWYRGRTVHIHAMVHVSNNRVLTTQMMFDEALNTKVFADKPYSAHTGRDTFNNNDSIFKDSMLAKVTEDGDGYLSAMVFGADSDKDGA
ncbi:protocatechuate dioxygenase [Rhizocola hellebori]|uniref:Protocatechuate dioxygenase n=1 Tax=Rhizocola hellebori TaxID=1392758 RepID=A0A8J3VHY5_9ACTN|nr:intradiol ring-cleavage dioxygenase [Rhizocola hellebori]GIH07000.1 protocatechuate dioxygenase [Rhizocola hellebori]